MDALDVMLVLAMLSVLAAVALGSFASGWFLRGFLQKDYEHSEYYRLRKSETALHKSKNCRALSGRALSAIETINVCKHCLKGKV